MSSLSLQRVEELFHQAVALPPGERAAFLAGACAGDADLRTAVEALLQHDDDESTGNFLHSPVTRPTAAGAATLPGQPSSAPAAPPPEVPGYQVLAELGRGGMGVVYKARHVSLNRIVALKMLLPGGGPLDAEQLARFRTEAEALARLQYPNVVAIYDVAACGDQPYFTMEFVAGPSLAHVLGGRAQDVQASARLLEVLARAVHAVHRCGIIHRDLKPANVLLRLAEGDSYAGTPNPARWLRSAVPKITDFGLAKDQAARRGLTHLGTALGTPCYMAPEQVESKAGTVGPAADIYGLGSILYEMLTGRPPFDAGSPGATIVQLLHDEPVSPAWLRPTLPHDLVAICLKCLEKSPQRRYGTALELAEDLRRFLARQPTQARPVGALGRAYRWCYRRPLVAALLALSAVLAVTALGTALVYQYLLNEALRQKEIALHEQVLQLNVEIGVNLLEAGDGFMAVLRFAEALRLDNDPSHARAYRDRIAAALRQSPRLLPAGAADAELGDPAPSPRAGVKSSDGRSIASLGPDNVLSVRELPSGNLIATFALPMPAATLVRRSPDGRLLLAAEADTARVWELPAGRAVTPPLRHGGKIVAAAFRAEGREIVLRTEDGVACRWEVLRPATDTAPADRPIAELVALAQALSGHRIDEHEKHVPLPAAELRRLRENHGAR